MSFRPPPPSRPAGPPLSGAGAEPPRRRAIAVTAENLVSEGPYSEGQNLPWVIQPRLGKLSLASWAASNRDQIDSRLRVSGAILFRGFEVGGLEAFEEVIRGVGGGALEYKERSSPRSRISGNVYTSTDYPPDQTIFLHNENSYQYTWPLKILFYCVVAPQQGGETPIADCRRVLQQINPEVLAKFRARQWSYVRNFGDGFGLSWETVFQTTDKEAVEEYCLERGIRCEWRDDKHLRTTAVRPAVTLHPKTGEPMWFNHATFFHVSTLPPEIRASLLAEFGESELPANTYYGDGSAIEPETLEHLRQIYQQETVMFPWQQEDVLLLDNMMVAHGRSPFSGPRKIAVGMAEPYDRSNTEAG